MQLLKNLFSLATLVLSFTASIAQGNCSDEDLLYIGNNLAFVQQVTADCGIDCLFAGDPEACFLNA